jgi:hypothetical protein
MSDWSLWAHTCIAMYHPGMEAWPKPELYHGQYLSDRIQTRRTNNVNLVQRPLCH